MLLMSHFDKTVMSAETWINNLNTVLWKLKTTKCHVTSSKQTFAIYPRLN